MYYRCVKFRSGDDYIATSFMSIFCAVKILVCNIYYNILYNRKYEIKDSIIDLMTNNKIEYFEFGVKYKRLYLLSLDIILATNKGIYYE